MDRPYIHEFIKQTRTLNKTYLSADLVPPVNPVEQQANAVQQVDEDQQLMESQISQLPRKKTKCLKDDYKLWTK